MRDNIEYNLSCIAATLPDRRERIATAVLAGIVAHHGETKDLVSRATAAVAYADALIAELDKEVKP